MQYDPPPGGVQGNCHITQARPERGGALSVAGAHVIPPSVLTSTPEIPRSPASATPPIVTAEPTTELCGGVATIAVVRICPPVPLLFVHPFCCQNPRNSPCTTVIRVSHLAWNIPYRPGTMIRAGAPCFGGRSSPFIRRATREVASRAFARGTPTVYPSTHVNATHLSAAGATPASARRSARGTPFQRAVPTRFPPTSLLTHSRVANSSRRAGGRESRRVFSCSRVYEAGVVTRPSIVRVQPAASPGGSRMYFVKTENSG